MYLTFLQPMRETPFIVQTVPTTSLYDMLWADDTTEPAVCAGLTIQQTEQYRDRWTVEITDEKAKDIFDKFFNNTQAQDIFLANQIHYPNNTFENGEYYRTFKIPKKTPGKYREICEPCPELKIQQKAYQQFLEYQVHALTHRSATAYVKGRSTVHDRMVHQANDSKWELKLDLKDFFPSCTKQFVENSLKNIYPFGVLHQHYPVHWLRTIESIDKCFYKNGLPQGTPMSPYLTNLIMVPIDEQIRRKFTNYHGFHLEYTRYADDITLSCKYKFDPDSVIKDIQKILKDNGAPFKLNLAKTKFQSTSGRNWSLGIMRNKENRLTVGHKNNQRLRAKVFQFYMQNLIETTTPLPEAQKLQGLISYYKMIDPGYTDYVLQKYERKFGRSFSDLMKVVLNQ